MTSFFSSIDISRKPCIGSRYGLKFSFLLSSAPRSFKISLTYSAIAGDAESPGDSTPATFIKFSAGELIIKSPVLPVARKPQNDVIVLLNGIPSTFSFASFIIEAKPSGVVVLSSLSSKSTDVGPVKRLPSTVGETRIPLPILLGVLNTVVFTSVPHSLSRSMYSPRLGVIVKLSSPTIFAMVSE